jgi:hypothetical protein
MPRFKLIAVRYGYLVEDTTTGAHVGGASREETANTIMDMLEAEHAPQKGVTLTVPHNKEEAPCTK